jgi:hypothetical protein
MRLYTAQLVNSGFQRGDGGAGADGSGDYKHHYDMAKRAAVGAQGWPTGEWAAAAG